MSSYFVCLDTHLVIYAAVFVEVQRLQSQTDLSVRQTGKHVNSSDSNKGLPSECLESSCDCPAPARVNIFKLCPLLGSHFTQLYPDNRVHLQHVEQMSPIPQFIFLSHFNSADPCKNQIIINSIKCPTSWQYFTAKIILDHRAQTLKGHSTSFTHDGQFTYYKQYFASCESVWSGATHLQQESRVRGIKFEQYPGFLHTSDEKPGYVLSHKNIFFLLFVDLDV